MNDQTTDLTDAELNVVSGGWFFWRNQAAAGSSSETLSSDVQKKLDDTVSGQQQKIG
jgi:hypothetical protein